MIRIERDDLTREAVHALDLSELRALKELSATHGEVNSMRTPHALRRRSFGFRDCGPFAGYGPDPNSVFMFREL